MNPIITAKNITKTYHVGEVDVPVIRGISFEIYEGEFLVILGPSGSGKSTVLNMLGGIDSISEGELYYKDTTLHQASEATLTRYRREHIGFVFQFYNLIPNLTAKENIELTTELTEQPISVDELLVQTGLAERANYFPSKMSGGQQQRVALARALSKNPDLLLCDEPTGALDAKTGAQVLEILANFNKTYKKTVVVITHNSDISKIADRVFTIKDGTISKIQENPNPLMPSEVSW